MYDTKIAIVVRNDLKTWQKLNVVAFLASAVAIEFPEVHGRKFVDASDKEYLSFIKNPILIFKADTLDIMKRTYSRGKERGIKIGIYTHPLFATKGEEQNLAEIRKLPENEQDYAGLVFYGERKLIDKTIKGLKLHD